MFPCLQPGDLLEIHRPASPIRTGDVVVFDRHGKLVVHRVAGQTGDLLITRGDRLHHPDAPVPADAILGCVTAIERRGRRISPRFTLWRRIVSTVLRHTELGTRVAVYSVRMVRT